MFQRAVIGLMITIQQMNKSISIQKEQSNYIKFKEFENKFFKLLDTLVQIKQNENILYYLYIRINR